MITPTAGETHREAFLRLLTEDGDTYDRRRKTAVARERTDQPPVIAEPYLEAP